MRKKRRISIVAIAVLIPSILLAMLLLTGGAGYLKRTDPPVDPKIVEVERVHYYAQDPDKKAPYNFGEDALEDAIEMVEAGEAATVEEALWKVNPDGTVGGIFYERMYHDPALMGAEATHMIYGTEVPGYVVLEDSWDSEFKSVPAPQLPDESHKDFLKDEAFWDATLENVVSILKNAKSVRVVKLGYYDSSMYMLPHELILSDGSRVPAVVVHDSINTGGHALEFDLGKAGVFRVRLECGFQPVDVPYWPHDPDDPPVDDLEPKDPNYVVPKTDDIQGGQKLEDQDTTLHPEEPVSNGKVNVVEPSNGGNNGGGNGGGGSTKPAGEPYGNHGGGGNENSGGKDYNVTTGNENITSDLDTRTENPEKEEPLSGDPENEGYLPGGAPE